MAIVALACVLTGWTAAGARQRAPAGEVLVFAASSLQTALDALAAPAQQATGFRMRMSYAASSALARQIEHGAPADVFMSADLDWMDYLEARRLIRPETRAALVGNALVLVAARARPVTVTIGPGFPLAQALGRDRLALADPAVVPAGRYARAALTSLGVWDSVATKIAAADNVRAALRLVAVGEAPLGIVYRTDALVEPAVVVVGVFPANSHPPIAYPVALTSRASPAVVALLRFLKGPAARQVFVNNGFIALTRD